GGSMGSEVAVPDAFDLFKALTRASGRPVFFNQILQSRNSRAWREALEATRAALREGYQIYGACNALPIAQTFTMANAQTRLQRLPAWHALLFAPVAERTSAFRDPARRPALRDGAEAMVSEYRIARVRDTAHRQWEKQTVGEVAAALGKHPVDALGHK